MDEKLFVGKSSLQFSAGKGSGGVASVTAWDSEFGFVEYLIRLQLDILVGCCSGGGSSSSVNITSSLFDRGPSCKA